MKHTVSSKANSFSATQRFSEQKPQAQKFWICLPSNMGPIGCPETSVNNYHSTLRNSLEQRGSQYQHICHFVSFVCKVSTAPIQNFNTCHCHCVFSSRFYIQNYSYIEPLPGKRVDTTADVHCSHIHCMRKDDFSYSFQHQSNITFFPPIA